MVKKVLFWLALAFLPFLIYPEVDLDASLSGIVLSSFGDDSNSTTAMGKGNIDIKSSGSKNVKSLLSLEVYSTVAGANIDVKKAWVKFRYPQFRGMVGKNRVTWGEGVVYNAGDVIFDDFVITNPLTGGTGEDLDLTADELKSANRIMATLTLPLGRFTFIEGIYMPYNFSLNYIKAFANPTGEGSAETLQNESKGLELQSHSFGGRFVTRAGGVKIESGYIYNGFDKLHKPYVSFNGTLLVDYHLSASVNINHDNTDFDSWKKSFKISTGDFYLFELEDDKTLTLRLESMVKPFGYWEVSTNKDEQKDYGLMLYPEVAYVPNDELSLFFRTIVSPIDLSAKTTLGVNWKTYQGFSIGTFVAANLGEEGDVYSWKGDGSLTFTVMVTHKF